MFTTRNARFGLLLALAFVFLIGAVSLLRAAEHSVPAPLKTSETKALGTFLVDPGGRTLYAFDNDTEPGKSTCYQGCARAWPAFSPKAGDPAPVAPLSLIARDDGSKQYAYNGKPLYYFAKDDKPGDAKGQGVGKKWWVVKP